MKKKPEQVSWWTFYIVWTLDNIREWCVELVGTLRIHLMGGWYCEYCREIHCRRVYKYKLMFDKDTATVADKSALYVDPKYCGRLVCSLGHDAIREGRVRFKGRNLIKQEDPIEQQNQNLLGM